MKLAYFDCSAGAGGDMIVAAMIDAGLDIEFLKGQLQSFGIDGLKVKAERSDRQGLHAIKFSVSADDQTHHRNLDDITKLINSSSISDIAKSTAIDIFNKLALAEAKVHNKDISQIHFHEVGAVDSIVDIVSAAIGIEALGIEKVFCSVLSVGGGTVKCDHGVMPVPAPATAELLKNIPIKGGPAQKELLTPTAAAVLTTVSGSFGVLPPMEITDTGCGAGTLELEGFPNILRLFIGRSADQDDQTTDSVSLLETNVDDLSGEVIGQITQIILAAGALDVFTTPIYMKQNRPAVKVSVLCNIQDTERIQRLLFENGLTFGIRKQILQRSKLQRKFIAVDTAFGKIRIKAGLLDGKIVNAKPEFADCSNAAQSCNVSVKEVIEAAMAAYNETNKS